MRNSNNTFLVNWKDEIQKLYGNIGLKKVIKIVEEVKLKKIKKIKNKFTNKDIFVIAYANSIRTKIPNIANVPSILSKYYKNINNIHFLPFFEWTSDDGFSVSNYYEVDSRNGSWYDFKNIDSKYNFMFDFVINHTSKSCLWFKNFLDNKEKWKDFYIDKNKDFDYSKIIRPRTTPLFHKYKDKEVWTTFSEDQVDLNYKSIDVLCEIIKLLCFYVTMGMTSVRLDAVGFIWKESGDTGMHHKNTHIIIKIIKSISTELFGELKIISEVNVPHNENMSYLGENGNESDEVYNFALPPLLIFSILTNNAKKIKKWMKFFDELKDNETMFNFLASHDGIGQRPIEQILNDEEKNILIKKAIDVNSLFNYKILPNNKKTFYEINSTYVDMIFDKNKEDLNYKKLLFSYSLILFLRGTPAIYFNSLFAKRNYFKGVKIEKQNRAINRETFSIETFDKNLSNKDLEFIKKLDKSMLIKINHKEFGPYEKQKRIENLPDDIIGFKRGKSLYIIASVSRNKKEVSFNSKIYKINSFEILIIKNNEIIDSIW